MLYFPDYVQPGYCTLLLTGRENGYRQWQGVLWVFHCPLPSRIFSKYLHSMNEKSAPDIYIEETERVHPVYTPRRRIPSPHCTRQIIQGILSLGYHCSLNSNWAKSLREPVSPLGSLTASWLIHRMGDGRMQWRGPGAGSGAAIVGRSVGMDCQHSCQARNRHGCPELNRLWV